MSEKDYGDEARGAQKYVHCLSFMFYSITQLDLHCNIIISNTNGILAVLWLLMPKISNDAFSTSVHFQQLSLVGDNGGLADLLRRTYFNLFLFQLQVINVLN